MIGWPRALETRFWLALGGGLVGTIVLFLALSELGPKLFTDKFLDMKVGDVCIVYLTYCLVIVGWFTMRSGERSSRSLERAYISIRANSGQLITHIMNAKLGVLAQSQKVQAEYYFVNAGKTAATVKSLHCSFDFTNEPLSTPPWRDAWTVTTPLGDILPSTNNDLVGGSRCEASSELDQDLAQRHAAGMIHGVFFGGIIYVDVFGETHETGWCYRTNRDGHLEEWGGPKFNYRT